MNYPKGIVLRMVAIVLCAIAAGIFISLAFNFSSFLLSLVFLGAIVFFVFMFYPRVGLILTLMAIHNPYYNYAYLALRGLRGGAVRAWISGGCVGLLLFGILLWIFLCPRPTRQKTPLDKPLFVFFSFSVLGAAYGFLRGNEPRLILAELFPIMEFGFFFFITTMLIRTKDQIKGLFSFLWIWMVINIIFEILLFMLATRRYGVRVPIGELEINRIPSYLMPMVLSVLIGAFVYSRDRKWGRLLMVSIGLAFIGLALSFWRSLYVGALAGMIFIFLMVKGIKMKMKYLIYATVILLIILSIGNIMSKYRPSVFKGASFSSLFLTRVVDIITPEPEEHLSKRARIEHNIVLPKEIVKHPVLGKGLGGAIVMPDGEVVHLLNTSNYYLNVAGSMGIPGLFFFLLTVFVLFKEGLFRFRNLEFGIYKGITLGLLASFVAMGVVFLVFPALIHFPAFAYLGMGAALIFIISQVDSEKSEK